ncbi:zinc-activated ligand-gated ion channel-like [Erpetoichthys calabaricus]|uniref:zinc-activated ligand-gated ion channel-like n=1 Tax=Erpetoichthys calabaricus TaxID=27687 RepID=UPI002234E901|nr:zinc-activated ligand-gated ion channel-like [Erpetoichthys calabaricus]
MLGKQQPLWMALIAGIVLPALHPMASATTCFSRRCLASLLLSNTSAYFIPSADDSGCSVQVHTMMAVFETLKVDTRDLFFDAILRMKLMWVDPSLSWNSSYPFNTMALPVDSVWTPNLTVRNALKLEKQSESSHVLVFRNGTVLYNYVMWITVGCDINLYKYPFARDSCLIAISGWNEEDCGVMLNIRDVHVVGKERGDWNTESVTIGQRDGHKIMTVSLWTDAYNIVFSLIIPSFMILAADIMGFALPVAGDGERVSYKVTLLLGFVMFLLILSDMLPGAPFCIPLIKHHFSISLIFLVVSTIETLLVTYLATNGLPCFSSSWARSTHPVVELQDQRKEPLHNGEECPGVGQDLPYNVPSFTLSNQRLSRYVELQELQHQQTERNKRFAVKVDRVCFVLYFIAFLMYLAVMTYMCIKSECDVNHMNF